MDIFMPVTNLTTHAQCHIQKLDNLLLVVKLKGTEVIDKILIIAV